MSNRTIKITAVIGALFLAIQFFAIPIAEAGPLQKVRMKIEGLHVGPHSDSLFKRLFSGFLTQDPVPEFHETRPFEKIESALLSIQGVKKVEFEILKKWLLFKDWKRTYVIVEFEQGALTSETLILAVESASDAKHVYKAKFVE
ncbi:MAG: hypothetical protein AAB317_03815 [Nitrospirota bacterium]